MFSRRLSGLARLRRTAGFRLALGYSLVLLLGILGVLGLAYYSLAVSLTNRDAEAIREKFTDMESDVLTRSLEQLEAESHFEFKRGRRGPFFMRVMSRDEKTVFYLQGQIDWRRLAGLPLSRSDRDMLRVPQTETEPELELISKPLSPTLTLQVGKGADARKDTLQRFELIVLGLLIPVMLAALAGGAFMANRALAPMRRLIETVETIRAGKLGARVPLRGVGDEFDELGVLFNGMLLKIETLVAGMRNALDNVAHDLRTPMTRLRGTAELALLDEGDEAACREALAECVEESDIVLQMLKTLMDISEAETGTMKLSLEPVELGRLLGEVAGIYRYVAEEKGIEVRVEAHDRVTLTCDRNRMRQVASNLLDNAVKYTPAGGAIELKTFRRGREAGLSVSDNGPGILPEDLPKIWDRLYRGDASRSQRGLGLGLSLVKAVVEAHRGSVEVESLPEAGSRFTVLIPEARHDVAEARSRANIAKM